MSKRYVLGESAARRLAQLLRGKGEVSSRHSGEAKVTEDSDFVAPFTVKWAQSSNDGAGNWIIWLPSAELVTLPEGVTIDVTEDLDAAGGDYPSGWYVVPSAFLDEDDGGTLYLNVTLGDSPAAEFSGNAVADAADEIDVPICAATVDAETGARWVKQFTNSAIVIGGDGSGGDGSVVVRVDDKSIDWRTDRESESESSPEIKSLQIKGWKTQAAALTSLVEALGLPLVGANNNNDNSQSEGASGSGSGSEIGSGSGSSGSGSSREVVVRNGPDGALEYVPVGVVDLAAILANINDGELSITYTDPSYGVVTKKFTANQATNTSMTIPAPGDGTITIKHGDTTLGYFTVNQTEDATVTIPAPGDGRLTIKYTDPNYGILTKTFTANQSTNTVVEIASPGDGTITLRLGSTDIDSFTVNQSANKTITIPSPGDGTITIRQGSTDIGSFTVNQSANKTITLAAPPSGSVVVLRKVKYDTSTHKIMAAYSKINLATGAVTAPSVNEIPADNDATLLWAEVTEAVPHSTASAAESESE